MTTGLDRQIKAIFQHIDGQQQPITAAAAKRRVLSRPGDAAPVRRRLSVAMVAAVAGSVALLVLLPLLLLRSGTTEPDVVTTLPLPTTTAAPPESSVPPTTSTTVAPTTTQARVAQDHDVAVTFDGSSCRYEGPATVFVRDRLHISVTNSSELFTQVSLYRLVSGESLDVLAEHALAPESAYETQTWGSVLGYVPAWPGSDGSTYYDAETGPDEDGFMPRFDRDFGFICWYSTSSSVQGTGVGLEGGIAADTGFSVEQ